MAALGDQYKMWPKVWLADIRCKTRGLKEKDWLGRVLGWLLRMNIKTNNYDNAKFGENDYI